MKNPILLPFVTAVVLILLGMGSTADSPALDAPGATPRTTTVATNSGSHENPGAGIMREVTAYNVGVRAQTDGRPCIGATGRDLCHLIMQGIKVCAANFVEPWTMLNIEGYGKCVVLDRMNRRFPHRVDIAMSKDEVAKALKFGVQRRHVKVRPGRS
jgi:3D (Asp-Asp-Asp) domain-containing protein